MADSKFEKCIVWVIWQGGCAMDEVSCEWCVVSGVLRVMCCEWCVASGVS